MRGERRSLKAILVNAADSNGLAELFIGCSAKDIARASLMKPAGGLTSKRIKKS